MNIHRLIKAIVITAAILISTIGISIGILLFVASYGLFGVSCLFGLLVVIVMVAMSYSYLGLED